MDEGAHRNGRNRVRRKQWRSFQRKSPSDPASRAAGFLIRAFPFLSKPRSPFDEAAMTRTFRPLRTIALCAVLSAFTNAADAAEIKLIASNAVKEAYSQLLPAYE